MATSLRFAPLALLALLACNEQQQYETPHPDAGFYYPQALALRHVLSGTQTPCAAGSTGCQTQLLVASTDFDLRYDPLDGGWLTVIDVDAAIAAIKDQPLPTMPPILGAAFMANYGGEIAVVDEDTCPTWTTHSGSTDPATAAFQNEPQVLIPSRSSNKLYRFHLDAAGKPTCHADATAGPADCEVPVHGPKSATGEVTVQAAQPYATAVACGVLPAYLDADGHPITDPAQILEQRYFAFVGFLQIESSTGALSQLDLTADAAGEDPMFAWRNLGIGTPHSMAYDAASTRLWATSRFAAVGSSPLRAVTLAAPSSAARVFNLEQWVRGVQQRGIALSADGTLAYVALGFYDITSAATFNGVPSLDLSGGLAVVDVSDLDLGGSIRVLDVARLDRGMTEVKVIPRPGLGDLVVTISNTDSSLWLYDVARGEVANVFGSFQGDTCGDPRDQNAPAPCRPGQPLVGKNPSGLAVELLADGKARIYVSSFDRYWVNVIKIDPAHPEKPPEEWYRFGPERT